jgi:hypothetical protein
VIDDELERKTKPKRRRRKGRRLTYDEDLGEAMPQRRRKSHDLDEWDTIDD